MDTFDDKVVSHILVAIEDIASSFAHKNDVDEFLRSIAMLCEESVILHIHISDDTLDAS